MNYRVLNYYVRVIAVLNKMIIVFYHGRKDTLEVSLHREQF